MAWHGGGDKWWRRRESNLVRFPYENTVSSLAKPRIYPTFTTSDAVVIEALRLRDQNPRPSFDLPNQSPEQVKIAGFAPASPGEFG